ncbi:MAG: DUF1460 domain-containing protein [Bacteroidales bacterium]|jgi:hypothetical protein|nr:DUF1460 domain-containing protein [Bacteroidales bacterium]
MNKPRGLFCGLLLGVCLATFGIEPEDSAVFRRFMHYVSESDPDIIRIASFFLDIPYVSGTLEGDAEERLRVNLREMDCFTFVENVIALHLMLQNNKQCADNSLDHFCEILQHIRYRNGVLNGYLSRLHYTSEWMDNNYRKGVLTLPQLPHCQTFRPEVSFMSTHCNIYPALQAHPEWCTAVGNIEKDINRLRLRYIPKEQTDDAAGIRNGDIIAITTHVKGLDVVHVGFAFHKGNSVYLIHASSEAGKIIISTETLYDYLQRRKNHSGIMVARIVR